MTLISAINVAKGNLAMEEADYRALLARVTGKDSLRQMNSDEHTRVLDELRAKGAPRQQPSKGLSGPYAKKLQALWIAGWNLGVIHNRTDAAMLTFIKGQTGIEHTRFLRAAADGKAAVEALKSWVARVGGVNWREFRDPQECVVEAQRRKLGADAPAPIGASKTEYMNLLGERIRAKAGA